MNCHELRRHRAAGLSTQRRRWRSFGRLRGAVARLANVRIESLEERRLLAADVAVTNIDAPDPVFAGNNLTYTLVVANNGDSAARNVTLTDGVPAGTALVSATQTSGPAFTLTLPPSGTSGQIGGTLAQLNSGDVATFHVVTRVDPGAANNSSLTGTATVTADADANSSNNSSTATTTVKTSADLVVTKTGPATAIIGSQVTYSITVVNNGPSDAQLYNVTDPTPAGLIGGSVNQTSGPPAGATLPAGATATFTAAFQVSSADANNTVITNTATATSPTADPNTANNRSSVTTTAFTPPSLSVQKAGPSRVFAGENVQYTITVQNSGGAPATHVKLSDLLPSREFFVTQAQTAGPAFTLSNIGNNVSDTIDSMPGLSTAIFLVTARVDPGIFRNTSISNTATLDADQPPAPTSASSTTSLLAVPSADIVVTKTGPSTIVAGTQVTYTVTLASKGPSDAQSVHFADILPNELTPVSFTQVSGPAFSLSFNGDHVYNAGRSSFGAGETAVFMVTAAAGPSLAAGTVVTNTALANTSSTQPNTADDTSSVSSTIQAQADLAITKTGPATVVTGQLINYDITIMNSGPSDAQNYGISDVLPGNVSFVSLNQSSGPPLGGALPPGATATFVLTGRVSAGTANNTQVRNTAAVTSPTSDPNSANNSATATTTALTPADVAVAKAGPPSVIAGNNIQYTITVRNKGGEPARNVTLSDLLPAREFFVSQTQTAGPAFTLSNSGNSVTDTIAIMPGLSTATIVVTARVDPAIFRNTSISNTATVSMDQTDPVTTDNSSTTSTLASAQADIVVTKTGPATVVAGTPVTYTVTLSNNGPSNAQSVHFADILPADLTPVSFTQQSGPAFSLSFNGDHVYNAGLSSFGAGETAVFLVTATVNPSAPDGETLINQAIANTSSNQPNTANDSATASSTVQTRADLQVNKSPDAGPVFEGGNITYHVTVTNAGPSDAQNVKLTDVVPAGATFVSDTQTGGPAFACTDPPVGGSGTITCTVPTLASGATATFTFVVHVPEEGSVSNTANVTTSTVDTDSSNDGATAVVVVQDLPLTTVSHPSLTGVEGTPLGGVTVATFTDANPNAPVSEFTATINWGDGTSSAATITQDAAKVFHVLGTHTYIEEGNFPVHVAIDDEGGASTAADGTARIADAPLSGNALPIAGVEGRSLTANVAHFTDSNPLAGPVSEYSATILWGDGTASAGTIVADNSPAGGYFVSGTHTYNAPGSYNTRVLIQDEGGAGLTLNGNAAIAAAPLTAFAQTISARKKTNFQGTVGSFKDADATNTSAGAYKITIDWGDGTAKTSGRAVFNRLSGRWDVVGSHTYAAKSTGAGYKVKITIVSGSQLGPQFQSLATALSTAVVTAGQGQDEEKQADRRG